LIQRTCQNALDEKLLGNANLFDARNAIYEMAKEPRFSRRALSDRMIQSMARFPYDRPGIVRNVSLMPSFYQGKAYVFLQIRHPNIVGYENKYRPVRARMLQIACGAAKNKFPDLNKVIGIAIDAPKFAKKNSEDFVLLDCESWPAEQATFYEEQNRALRFFATDSMRVEKKTVSNFPPAASTATAG